MTIGHGLSTLTTFLVFGRRRRLRARLRLCAHHRSRPGDGAQWCGHVAVHRPRVEHLENADETALHFGEALFRVSAEELPDWRGGGFSERRRRFLFDAP